MSILTDIQRAYKRSLRIPPLGIRDGCSPKTREFILIVTEGICGDIAEAVLDLQLETQESAPSQLKDLWNKRVLGWPKEALGGLPWLVASRYIGLPYGDYVYDLRTLDS